MPRGYTSQSAICFSEIQVEVMFSKIHLRSSIHTNYTSIDPKQLQNDSFRPISIKNRFLGTFTPRANCFINEFLSALTSLFVRPHSSPVSRATETSHRVQGRGQDKDKRRTRPGHRAGPQSPATEFRGAAKTRTRGGQEEDKAQPQSPATELSHRVQGRGQ